MKPLFWMALLISLIVNACFIFNQTNSHGETIKPIQNELKPIILRESYSNFVTNTVTIEYTPQQAIDELNRYRTNAFIVTVTNYRARVSLVERKVEFDLPRKKEIDNLINTSVFLSGSLSAGYWRRVFNLFDYPIYLGCVLDYRKESGLNAGVSVIVGF